MNAENNMSMNTENNVNTENAVNQIRNEVSRINGVGTCSVRMDKNIAYIAVKLNNNNTSTTAIKEQIKTIINDVNANIIKARIYFDEKVYDSFNSNQVWIIELIIACTCYSTYMFKACIRQIRSILGSECKSFSYM